jgi:hypothetical protein
VTLETTHSILCALPCIAGFALKAIALVITGAIR